MSSAELLLLIESFKNDHKTAIASFYIGQREVFLRWAKSKYDIDEASMLDVYQDAIIVFYKNALDNKLDHVTGSPEGYLFGIAKNLLLKKQAREKRTLYVEEINSSHINEFDFDLFNHDVTEEKKIVLDRAMRKLKENCRKIIRLYYYKNYNMESISNEMGFENKDVAKSRKYQCLKALRKIINLENGRS